MILSSLLVLAQAGVGSSPIALPTAEMIEGGFEAQFLGDRHLEGRPAVSYSLMMYPFVETAKCHASSDNSKVQCSYNVEWKCDLAEQPLNKIDLIEQRLDNFSYNNDSGWTRGAPIREPQYFYLTNGDWKQSPNSIIPC